MEPECLCVTDEGLCSDERNGDIQYMLLFSGWGGSSGFLFVLLGDDMFLF